MNTMQDVKNKIEKCDDKTLLGGIAFFNSIEMHPELRKECQPVINLATKELDKRTTNGTRTD